MTTPASVPPTTSRFRDISDQLSPTHLLGPNGTKYRYSMHVIYDALFDSAQYAVLARFPDRAPPDAFQWIAADRLIQQGFSESNSSYIGRLKQWLDLWGFAGTTTGMLLAVLGDLLPVQPQVRTVDNNGQWYTYAASANPLGPPPASLPTPPVQLPAAGNWQWDSVGQPASYAELWARMWVIVYSLSGSPWSAPSATYGISHTYGDGTCWGWAGTNSQAASLTAIARLWRAGHCVVPFVIVSYDSTMFDPAQSFGSSKLPDGNWGHWSKIVNGQYVPARSTLASYLDGGP